jgi:hypothetical protein
MYGTVQPAVAWYVVTASTKNDNAKKKQTATRITATMGICGDL